MEQPPIRILRRPCPVSTENSDLPHKPTVTGKTFEQREADYAAARERIFGQLNLELSDPNNVLTYVEPKLPSPSSLPSLTVNASTTVASSSASDLPVSTPCLGFQNNAPLLGTPTNRQSLAVVNVGRKLQQQYSQVVSNGSRPNVQSQQQQQRILTASASSPSFFNQPGRNTQPIPLFSSQVGNCNAGLLPTPTPTPPPGFNFSMQPNVTSNNGLQNSQATAITLMHQFNLLQYYQQTLNGIQNQLIPSSTSNSLSSNPLNFAPIISQPNNNHKYTHPHTFN